MSAAAGAAVAAAIEEHFKNYLVICEYLQINPAEVHDEELICSRAKEFLSNTGIADEKAAKKLNKKIDWFIKQYKGLTGRLYGFVKRCQKLIAKDYLRIFPGTVNEEFIRRNLSQENYDYYVLKQRKPTLIALGITLGVILAIGLTLVLIFT